MIRDWTQPVFGNFYSKSSGWCISQYFNNFQKNKKIRKPPATFPLIFSWVFLRSTKLIQKICGKKPADFLFKHITRDFHSKYQKIGDSYWSSSDLTQLLKYTSEYFPRSWNNLLTWGAFGIDKEHRKIGYFLFFTVFFLLADSFPELFHRQR